MTVNGWLMTGVRTFHIIRIAVALFAGAIPSEPSGLNMICIKYLRRNSHTCCKPLSKRSQLNPSCDGLAI